MAAGFVLAAFAILVWLGTWQLERRAWKEGLIAERAAALSAPPVPLPAADARLHELAYRRVAVTGRFRHEAEILLANRTLVASGAQMARTGFHVITPLVRADGSAILVDRGFIPLDRKAPATRAAGQVEGEVTVEGLLVEPPPRGRFAPDNDPAGGLWYWTDLAAMSAKAGIPARPYLLEAGPAQNPGGLPIGGQSRVDLPNDHLQYAITWYALALVLIVIFSLYRRARLSQDRPR